MGKNWHDILDEINAHQQEHSIAAAQTIDLVRRQYLKNLADLTGRNTIAYYSGFMSKGNVEGIDINDDDINAFMACVHGLPKDKGLDIILHTPGGAIAATEALVSYLRQMFDGNIRAIVPQIAMSAGTMVALSCKSILMGTHSSLGPIDPQIGGIPAEVVMTEFQRAYDEIKAEPMRAHVWAPILSRYAPSFLTQCEYAVEWSKDFVRKSLENNMFSGESSKTELASNVVNALSSAALNKAHNKHIHADQLVSLKLKIEKLEANQALQDAVLAVHHCFMHTMASTTALKVVENHFGRAAVRHVAQPAGPRAISFGIANPA